MRHLKYCVVAFLLFAGKQGIAQIDSVQYVIDSTLKVSPFYGNILITQHGKTVFEKSYGYADVKTKQPLTSNNSFQIASISKQFTAYGIMLLQQKGLVDYDQLVRTYLPEFPYDTITVRHLLNHTSGLPEFWDVIRPNLDTTRSNGNKDAMDYLVKHKLPLQFKPGTQFEYCDIGYDFLANIIERLSGMNYETFMEKQIFKSLGMTQTHAYMVTDIQRIKNPNLAIGHVYQDQQFVYAHTQTRNNFVFYLGDFYGDGSVVTSAKDLAIWERALSSCKLLPCAQQNLSIEPIRLHDSILYMDPNLSYGFGWFLKYTPSDTLVYHTGFHPGNVHSVYRLMQKDITFIFLSNAETSRIRGLRSRILQLLNK